MEDDPQGAARAYAVAIRSARRLLIEGLIGQARALAQLDRKQECDQCVAELIRLADVGPRTPSNGAGPFTTDGLLKSPSGQRSAGHVNGPYARQIEELLEELGVSHSA